MTDPMRIELLYFDGCPGHERLLPRLRRMLADAEDDEIDLIRVESPEAAERHRFLGSPTLRIDGVDVEPGAELRTDYGMTCRLYRTPEGARQPLPHDDWISAAIERARSARDLDGGRPCAGHPDPV